MYEDTNFPDFGETNQNLGMGARSAMQSDWNSYFNSATPGSSINWGGGTLTMGANGDAKYAAQGALNGGTTLNRNSIDNPNTLQSLMAQAPGIAKQWRDQYGVTSGISENDQNYWNNILGQQSGQGSAGAPTGNGNAPTGAAGTVTTPAFNLNNIQGAGGWGVDPKTQTVAGQLSAIIASDSPLMQQARARALQTSNDRGLLNSNLALGAADAAVYDKAFQIADSDAAIYADAAKTNVTEANAFSRDANRNAYDLYGKQVQYGYDTKSKADQFRYDTKLNADQFGYDMRKLGEQTAANKDLAKIDSDYRQLTQASSSATTILANMQSSLNNLMNNTSITDETIRQQMADDIKQNSRDSLNLIGALAGDIELGKYITDIGLDAPVPDVGLDAPVPDFWL